MQEMKLTKERLIGETQISQMREDGAVILFPKKNGGIDLPELKDWTERYFRFTMEIMEDHTQSFDLCFFAKGQKAGEKPRFFVKFGALPNIPTQICIDMQWTDGKQTFPDHVEGALKFVNLGNRIDKGEIDRVVLTTTPSHHELKIGLTQLRLTDEKAEAYPLPDIKLIDAIGQLKTKEWPQKVPNLEDMKRRLQKNVEEAKCEYVYADRSRYGGCNKQKLAEGSGFFGKIKKDDRWYLVDPEGYAFFSLGPDVIAIGGECRIDGWEKYMDWLPAEDDPEYAHMFDKHEYPPFNTGTFRYRKIFSFMEANLYRALGKDWHPQWMKLIGSTLKQNGMNTVALWSDGRLSQATQLPYVSTLPKFPKTKEFIFRDFPDVFSEEYRTDARECAKALLPTKEDPFLIGYFLRNEPLWAFADGLIIADEVLSNPMQSDSRTAYIKMLKDKYESIEALSKAWNQTFGSFDDLQKSIDRASSFSAEAMEDAREFSRRMMDTYTRIPAEECRITDPNHMNLGMRWAWITDPDVITGWQYFDVFSINCYEVDPKSFLDQVVGLGVDLPIVIGEFQFGALDAGQTATGLESAASQVDRAKSYRFYCEQVAAHTHGVGCHWFQCYDQFALGRTDGENYNIGIFDICSQPAEVLLNGMKKTGETIYQVATGEIPPTSERGVHIPKIAF